MCRYLFSFLTWLLLSAGVGSCRQQPAHQATGPEPSVALLSNQLAGAIEPRAGTNFLDAAAVAEVNSRAFEAPVLAVGLALNESISTSLQLSSASKAKLDSSLRQNCPALSAELRQRYLAGIPELTDSTRFGTRTTNSLRADVLADAMGQLLCSYSTLVFGVLRMNPSLSTVMVAGSLLQAPCERLMQSPLLALTGHLERSGLVRDVNTTTAMLKADQISGAAELGTARLGFQVSVQRTVHRSVGYRGFRREWEAGRLVQTYHAQVVYGYDFAADSSFQVSVDEARHQLLICLPAVSCLSVSLEPCSTVMQDSGLPDISLDDLQTGFVQARQSAVELARTRGAEKLATEHATHFLRALYAPLAATRHGQYTLCFRPASASLAPPSSPKAPALL